MVLVRDLVPKYMELGERCDPTLQDSGLRAVRSTIHTLSGLMVEPIGDQPPVVSLIVESVFRDKQIYDTLEELAETRDEETLVTCRLGPFSAELQVTSSALSALTDCQRYRCSDETNVPPFLVAYDDSLDRRVVFPLDFLASALLARAGATLADVPMSDDERAQRERVLRFPSTPLSVARDDLRELERILESVEGAQRDKKQRKLLRSEIAMLEEVIRSRAS